MKISLITVSFNSEKTIEQTFQSVKNQVIDEFELEYILIDGLSNDGTLEISNNYNDLISIKVSEKDSGIYNAMNKGIKYATGDIIGFLNSDDNFIDDYVLQSISKCFTDKELDIVYGDINYVNSSGKIIRKWITGEKKSFSNGWHPAHPAFYAKKKLFDSYGGFDESFTITADFDLMLRFMEVVNSTHKYLPKVFVNMKLGGESNQSIKNILKGNKQIISSFKKCNIQPQFLYTQRRWLRKLVQYIN